MGRREEDKSIQGERDGSRTHGALRRWWTAGRQADDEAATGYESPTSFLGTEARSDLPMLAHAGPVRRALTRSTR